MPKEEQEAPKEADKEESKEESTLSEWGSTLLEQLREAAAKEEEEKARKARMEEERERARVWLQGGRSWLL